MRAKRPVVEHRTRGADFERREASARAAGYSSWVEAVRATGGETRRRAAEILATPDTTITYWRDHLGVPSVRRRATPLTRYPTTYEAVRATASMPVRVAARETGLSVEEVRSRRRALGITPTPVRRTTPVQERSREYQDERARALGYEGFLDAVARTRSGPARELATAIGVSETVVSRVRREADARATGRDRLDAAARALGYLSFSDGLRETRGLSEEGAADALETTVARVREARPAALVPWPNLERSAATRDLLVELTGRGWPKTEISARSGVASAVLSRATRTTPPDFLARGTADAIRPLLLLPVPSATSWRTAARVPVEEVSAAVKELCLSMSQGGVSRLTGVAQVKVSAIERRVALTVSSEERDRILAAHEEHVRARR